MSRPPVPKLAMDLLYGSMQSAASSRGGQPRLLSLRIHAFQNVQVSPF